MQVSPNPFSFRHALKKNHLVWFVLTIGLVATVLFSLKMKEQVDNDAIKQFAHASDQITLKIRDRLAAQELILRGAAGFFVASDHLDHNDWKRYWNTLKLEQNLPGVQGFGLALLVRSSQLNQHIAEIRQEGIPDYTVRPAGKRDLYAPIVYLEPSNDRNLRALGYDVFSEPVRRAALISARDTGQATLTGKLALVQENGKDVQAGVIMYVPVYRRELPTDTVLQRQQALIGWTNSPYRMSDLILGILHDWQRQLGKDFNLFVYDGLHPTEPVRFSVCMRS